ncbi:MAG: FAD-dependent oxidoreductase [Proteobacteria bacterium]|nr:FAD-dependent oxidoreductase [Pseudomonadota bacterium]MCP4917405.1 FAD-dependent oxidoreductase [Pseudomonadota bacterium]
MNIVIVGGVAAGASCAARARRLDERARITVFEKGPHVSFANCGLPYHVGDVIPDESDLLLVTPERFKERFDIDVRIRHEVTRIDRDRQVVEVLDLETGATHDEPYDALVLATGAGAFRPPVEGLDLPGVFTLRTVPETRRVKEWMTSTQATRAVVVGAGFVGLEVAENLVRKGLEVTVVERAPQVLANLDPEMAARAESHLREHGVALALGESLTAIEADADGLRVRTDAGSELEADLVILGLGVRPRAALAEAAGLELGPHGGIQVGTDLRTSDPRIWAVGDVVQSTCSVTGLPTYAPLAGPANRMGRMAADALAGRPVAFRGVQGTAVCGLFGMTVASTGKSATALTRAGVPFAAAWLHPKDHVGYYPGATTMHLKLVYDPADGRVLGAQAVGADGVAKRIDVIAMAIQLGGTVYDLEQSELCYAPQFGAAKDPVNIAGMIAGNRLRGDLPAADWAHVPADAMLVDVREPHEFAVEHVPGALSLPLSELRGRLDELPDDRTLWLYCRSGKRSYDAARALTQRGFDVRTIQGGLMSRP